MSDTLLSLPENYNRVDTTYFDSRQIKSVSYFRDPYIVKRVAFSSAGILHGVWKFDEYGKQIWGMTWYENGQIEQLVYSTNGHWIKGTSWYQDGTISSETYSGGGDTIYMKTYYSNGKIKEVRQEISDRPIHAITYCENGQVISENFWGTKNPYKQFYCNGKLRVVATKNSDGFFYGKYSMQDENGVIRIKGNYSDTINFSHQISGSDGGLGQKKGIWQYYNEKGKLEKQETYENGILIETRLYKKKRCISVTK